MATENQGQGTGINKNICPVTNSIIVSGGSLDCRKSYLAKCNAIQRILLIIDIILENSGYVLGCCFFTETFEVKERG